MDAICPGSTHSTCARFEDALEGSIETGMLADLVSFPEDPSDLRRTG
jgi:predicted amidohydrolase YtcJ